MLSTLAATSLYATICIPGTLHGLPHDACREFQIIKGYSSTVVCDKDPGQEHYLSEFLHSLAWLDPTLQSYRCGPSTPDSSDNDL